MDDPDIVAGQVEVAVDVSDEAATGVTLATGESVGANGVVSGLDPKRTLLGLVDIYQLNR